MAEVIIVKENQKRLKAKKILNFMAFAELMAYSKVEAAQYVIDCWINTRIMGMKPEDFIKSVESKRNQVKEEKVIIKEPKIEEETEKTDWEVELSKEDLQELLKSNNIEFKKTLWQKKLLELAQESGLL